MAIRTCYRVSLILFVFSLAASITWATTTVFPLPAEMVAQADFIVEGRLTVHDDAVALEIDEIMKGTSSKRTKLALISEHSILDFSLSRVARRRGSETVIVLGRLDEQTGTLVLPWMDASIWPREATTVADGPLTLESARALVTGLDRLRKVAEQGSDQLVADLVSGMEAPESRLVVLGFVESRLDEFVREPEQHHALLLVMGAQLTEDRPMDVATVSSVARISNLLPPSAALNYLMEAARSENPRVAQQAYQRARSILSARRLIEPNEAREIHDLATMGAIVVRELPSLRIEDAKKALKIFDSTGEELRLRASDVVAIMLGEPRPHSAPSDLEAARSFWTAKIDSAQAELHETD